jgi:hypothetical protein
MKTPHAILIGLSLIAATIFFKDTAENFTLIKDAHAKNAGNNAYTTCYLDRMEDVHTDWSGEMLNSYCQAKNP